MILVSTESATTGEIEQVFGIVIGNTIRARSVGRDLLAKMKNMIGGEIEEYTKLMAEARDQAMDRMMKEAEKLGANAVIGVRLATSEIMNNAAEIVAYGTAVLIKEK
jgi:uncharacterized protein YbjQ (UPF0145 family)